MSFRDISGSFCSFAGGFGGSGRLRTGLREPENGRPLTEPRPLDVGLCCHDNVPLLDKVAAFVAGNEGLGGCSGDEG